MVLSMCVGVLCELKFGQKEVCTSILGNVQGDSAILFGKVCLWVLVLLFTACAQHHHSQARSRGYLRFYRRMQGLKHLPLSVHSAGTTARLATAMEMYHMCRGKFSPQDGSNAKGGCVFFCMFVCRKCPAPGSSSCTSITYVAHLRVAQHPRVGALGDIAMSVLLHRYGVPRYNILILDTL